MLEYMALSKESTGIGESQITVRRTCGMTQKPQRRSDLEIRSAIRRGARNLRRLRVAAWSSVAAIFLWCAVQPKPEFLQRVEMPVLLGLAALSVVLMACLRFSSCPQCGRLFYGFLSRDFPMGTCAHCGVRISSGAFGP